jgi:hypothetical protein
VRHPGNCFRNGVLKVEKKIIYDVAVVHANYMASMKYWCIWRRTLEVNRQDYRMLSFVKGNMKTYTSIETQIFKPLSPFSQIRSPLIQGPLLSA